TDLTVGSLSASPPDIYHQVPAPHVALPAPPNGHSALTHLRILNSRSKLTDLELRPLLAALPRLTHLVIITSKLKKSLNYDNEANEPEERPFSLLALAPHYIASRSL